MKNLEEKFNEVRAMPTLKNLSDYLCLARVVYGKGYTFAEIKDAFFKLVRKDEYSRADLDEILQDLYRKTLIGVP